MSFYLNTDQEEAFNLVTDYLNERHMKILDSTPSSHIEAKFGSLWSLSPNNEKGNAKIEIVKKKKGRLINIEFDFSSTLVLALAVTIMTAIILFSFSYEYLKNGCLSICLIGIWATASSPIGNCRL